MPAVDMPVDAVEVARMVIVVAEALVATTVFVSNARLPRNTTKAYH